MRLRFLGTSAAWTLPYPGCPCPQCASVDPRDRRTRSSLWVSPGILVDVSPDFRTQWDRVGRPPVRDVLITHGHRDHCFGLISLPGCERKKPVSPTSVISGFRMRNWKRI
jgi:phosphoribosyl 1,2-cyclic phosphate phosphodiesterase